MTEDDMIEMEQMDAQGSITKKCRAPAGYSLYNRVASQRDLGRSQPVTPQHNGGHRMRQDPHIYKHTSPNHTVSASTAGAFTSFVSEAWD